MTPKTPSGYPRVNATAEELDAFVRDGAADQRWHATACENLSRWAMEQLASDPDENVRAALLDHWRLPTELLERMWSANPQMRERIARHYNASPAMKGPVPLWQHSSRAVELYAEARGATPEMRHKILEVHATADHDHVTLEQAYDALLGEV